MLRAPAGSAEAAERRQRDRREVQPEQALAQRAYARHDPVAWKYHHVGNFMLNEVLPPNNGQL